MISTGLLGPGCGQFVLDLAGHFAGRATRELIMLTVLFALSAALLIRDLVA
jgi:hypothetical protein